MSNVVFVPSLCKDQVIDKDGEPEVEPAKFKGELVLKRPNFEQREEYKKHLLNLKFKEGKVQLNQDSVTDMVGLVKDSVSHYVKVDLEKIETGEKYKSFDDLSYDVACDPILYEVGIQLVTGFPMGKS